jgi:hypothetical protein
MTWTRSRCGRVRCRKAPGGNDDARIDLDGIDVDLRSSHRIERMLPPAPMPRTSARRPGTSSGPSAKAS